MNKSTLIATIAIFTGSIGIKAQAPEVLIGTANAGGTSGFGTVFYTQVGSPSFSNTISFSGPTNASAPQGGVVLAPNGRFYGMSYSGGSNYGTIYEFTYTGGINNLVNFAGISGPASGSYPYGKLLRAQDGNLYGMTYSGGSPNLGVLFQYVPGNTGINVLHTFTGGAADGANPYGSLIQGFDGKLYGITSAGGSSNQGAIFSYDIGLSMFTLLHSFVSASDGIAPRGDLVQSTADHFLYGMTYTGGPNNGGCIFKCDTTGAGFTVLKAFTSTTDGTNPCGALVETSPGVFYGLNSAGGGPNFGTLFQFTAPSSFTVLHTFANTSDGKNPMGGLAKASNGKLYGVTNAGPASGMGTTFEFNPVGAVYTTLASFSGSQGGNNPIYVTPLVYLPLDATIAGNDVLCFGGSSGSATVTPTGGTAPYTYTWTPSGGNSATATGLAAGTYTCSIMEKGGYIINKIITINQPASPVSGVITGQTNVNCFGGNDGTATVSPSGGTPGYTYNWAPLGGTGITGTGMQAGTSTVTITDANGCAGTMTVSLTQPSTLPSANVASQTNVLCNGATTGSASISVGGGTAPYVYSWSPSGGTAATATGLAAGNYTCNINDNNGCITTQTVTITEPSALNTILTGQTNVSCNGGTDGSASIIAGGGAGGYTYNWTPYGGTSNVASALNAQTFTCNVTDANGCIATQTVSVSQPAILNASIAGSTNVSCNGFNDGTATANGTGGTGPYSYAWSPAGGSSVTATGLAPGTYTCTVTDANFCTATTTVSITQPSALSATPTTSSVTCNGGNDGSITVTPSGGVPSYTYSWSPNVTSSSMAVNLSAGNYTITVTDMNGCNYVLMPSVNQPSAFSGGISLISDVLCNGGSTGSLKAVVSGGTGALAYSWSPGGAITNQVNGLTAGTYTCTVTDANSCSTAFTGTVNQPAALVVSSLSSTDVLCYGNSEGQASINSPSGGTPGYTIDWTPGTPIGDGTVDVTSLTAGSYTCTVTDANGCTGTANFTINQPSALTIGVGTITNVSCNGGNDGSGSVIVGGGTPSYSYNWTPSGGSSAMGTNLIAGSYTCNVTDANGCTINKSISITEPSALSAFMASQIDVSCNGSIDGSASVSVSGGSPSYTYQWNDPGNQTTATASTLPAGSYTCTITDANFCTTTQIVTINEPFAIVSGIASTDALCNGSMDGSITTSATGGTSPYTYSWAPSGGTASSASGLGHATYTVTITDNNGCVLIDSAIVNEPTGLVNNMSGTDVTCFGANDGIAVDNITGGTPPYTYSWSPSGQTTQTATGLGAGNFTCTVTDANGCSTFDFSTIAEPAQLTGTAAETTPAGCAGQANGVADVTVSGGIAPYSYSWSSGGTISTETGLIAGTYTCSITDANLCAASATVAITESTNTDLVGNLTFAGGTISAGFVYAFKQQASINGIDTVDIAPVVLGSPATYTFSGLPADNYFVKAILDTTGNPNAVPTYYGNTFQWDSSTVVIHGCAQNDTANIDIITIDTTTGNGSVSGFIIEGQGFQGLRLNNGNNPNVPFVPGGPLKGIDVKLGKNPSGGIQARTSSDSSGFYQFSNIPDGSYKIYVDIPNLPMDSTREVTIDAGNPNSNQNNYIADSLVIYVDTAQVNGIHASEKIYDNNFSIFPNPTTNIMNLSFTLTNDVTHANVQLTNSMGAIVFSDKIGTISKGNNIYTINANSIGLKAGVYFVNLILDNRIYTQRIVMIE